VLNNRSQQAEDAHDNEACPENQRRVGRIVHRVQAGRVQVGGELADAEPETDQRERRANPSHQRSFAASRLRSLASSLAMLEATGLSVIGGFPVLGRITMVAKNTSD